MKRNLTFRAAMYVQKLMALAGYRDPENLSNIVSAAWRHGYQTAQRDMRKAHGIAASKGEQA